MKRFKATRTDRAKATKIVKKKIKDGDTQYSLAERYDTHQTVISQMLHGYKVSSQVVKSVLDGEAT